MMDPVRNRKMKVLHIVGKMHPGGIETLLMNVYRNIDRDRYEFHFAVQSPEPAFYDDEIRALGGGNVMAARRKAPLPRGTLERAEAIYRERHATPEGKIAASFEFVYLTGWAPHASQQKPLAPGSAKARLADALDGPFLE